MGFPTRQDIPEVFRISPYDARDGGLGFEPSYRPSPTITQIMPPNTTHAISVKRDRVWEEQDLFQSTFFRWCSFEVVNHALESVNFREENPGVRCLVCVGETLLYYHPG